MHNHCTIVLGSYFSLVLVKVQYQQEIFCFCFFCFLELEFKVIPDDTADTALLV